MEASAGGDGGGAESGGRLLEDLSKLQIVQRHFEWNPNIPASRTPKI